MASIKQFFTLLADAEKELQRIRSDCQAGVVSVSELVAKAPPEVNDSARTAAYVLLYSYWERCFVQSLALCLRIVANEVQQASEATCGQQSFWLKESPHFRSHISTIREVLEFDYETSFRLHITKQRRKADKTAWRLAHKSLDELSKWLNQPLTVSTDFDALVVTFSNVKKDVVTLNCDAIGITAIPEWASVDLSELDKVVEFRNRIAHGESLKAPGPRETADAIKVMSTISLSFSVAVGVWIKKRKPLFILRTFKRCPQRIRKSLARAIGA